MIKIQEKQRTLWDHALFTNITIKDGLLQEISDFLDNNPQILHLVWKDLTRSASDKKIQLKENFAGRKGITAEQVLRFFIYKVIHNFSYRVGVRMLNRDLEGRRFTRFYSDKIPSYTTFNVWIGKLQAEMKVFENMPKKQGRPKRKSLRVDCTGVESNIIHPRDSQLLSKGIEVLVRWGKRLKEEENWLPFHIPNSTFSSKRLSRIIAAIHGRNSKKRRKKVYKKLISKVEKILNVCKEIICFCTSEEVKDKIGIKGGSCLQYLSHYEHLVQKVLNQTKLRVIEEKPVKVSDKVLSLFEEHTDVIITGKKNDPLFGHKVLLVENEYGLLTDFEVLKGNANDATLVSRIIEGYKKIQNESPDLIALDRGFYSKENKKILEEWGVKQVCLPKRGYKTKEEKAWENQLWFKNTRKMRSGIEGRISCLKRDFVLKRCPLKGFDHFKLHVAFSILCHNLVKIGIIGLERKQKKLRRKYGGKKAA
ncbi:MAG: ISNCY family transposase [bacterium]